MLKMTDEQRYDAVLKELGEVLQHKNTTINCQRWQIEQLQDKLAEAEKQIEEQRSRVIELERVMCAELAKGGAA